MVTPSDEGLAAWEAFLGAHAAVTRMLERELLEERGLSLPFYEVLLRLRHAPDRRMRMQQLADEVYFSRSGLTRLVARMEEEGLVERVPCDTDRRGVEAVLTEEGLARLREAAPVHLRGIQEHFASHLSPSAARTLARALGRVADSLP
jgi:DNA-binding MarR family transcriptional regulator